MELDLRVAHLTCIRRLRRELDNMHTYFFIMFWSSVDAARPQFLHTYYHIPFVVLHWRLCDWSLRRRVVCAVVCRYLYPPGVHVTGRHVLSEQISGRGNFMLILIHRNIMWGSFNGFDIDGCAMSHCARVWSVQLPVNTKPPDMHDNCQYLYLPGVCDNCSYAWQWWLSDWRFIVSWQDACLEADDPYEFIGLSKMVGRIPMNL